MLFPVVYGFYAGADNIIQANTYNFKKHVFKTEHAVLAEFYAPWCGHCKSLVPEMLKAAQKLKGLAKVVAVDCDDKVNEQLCAQFQIQGFPTLKIFPGGIKGSPTDYQGERSAKALVREVTNSITRKYIVTIGPKKPLDDFKAGPMPKVILVSKASPAPFYKALSVTFKNRMEFGFLQAGNSPELNANAPALVIIKESEVINFSGSLKDRKAVSDFIKSHALEKPVSVASESASEDAPNKKEKPVKKQKKEKKEKPVKKQTTKEKPAKKQTTKEKPAKKKAKKATKKSGKCPHSSGESCDKPHDEL